MVVMTNNKKKGSREPEENAVEKSVAKEEVASLADDVKTALQTKKSADIKSPTVSADDESDDKEEEFEEDPKEDDEEEEQEPEKPEAKPADSFKVPLDIAGAIANLWIRALKEMQKRGILDEDNELPSFFRAEALHDGSLLLRAINMPSGIVMVGSSGFQPWNNPTQPQQSAAAQVAPSVAAQPTPPSQSAPDPRFKTLYVPEEGETVCE